MPIAVVYVDVSPPAPAPALEQALIRACTEAAHADCEMSTSEDSVSEASVASKAQVTWSTPTTADVEVTSQDGRRRVRHIAFRPSDGETERWQAIGLVVASLVTSDEGLPPPAPEPENVMTLPRRVPNDVWMGLGALLGNGTSPGPMRYGGWLDAGYQIASLPAFVSLGSSYALAAENASGVRAEWATFSLGGGARLEAKALRLLLRPGLMVSFQRVSAQSGRHPGFVPTSGSRWVPATQAVLSLCWPTRSSVALTFGALGSFSTGATGVRDNGQEVASFPSLAYTLTLGVEAHFAN